jgi:hypothetical protein
MQVESASGIKFITQKCYRFYRFNW